MIVDADDPLTEIQGEFVWLEEHQRAISAARESAYAEGYAAGRATIDDVRMYVVHRGRRRSLLTIAMVSALALIVLLMLPVVLR
ncbi:hypothetical protein [Nocardioides iriomotensis]|uniref:Uncharacterized protein n=1 Tax=Nocardioides iriomotensis TaxID=715784 RepID=A0A4Q5JA82_9ACTN|nr:hypothetical protein [Nocardioides iriomotensis]RYU14801.1 hypothetical protein ETU37_02090 [Nocardioides iriomotensis]